MLRERKTFWLLWWCNYTPQKKQIFKFNSWNKHDIILYYDNQDQQVAVQAKTCADTGVSRAGDRNLNRCGISRNIFNCRVCVLLRVVSLVIDIVNCTTESVGMTILYIIHTGCDQKLFLEILGLLFPHCVFPTVLSPHAFTSCISQPRFYIQHFT